ncbi:sentrin/sumo-specific protease [Aphelenchoides avenae]|nr:sentrin/sumo-specific protease [Aphelenchus avenae]
MLESDVPSSSTKRPFVKTDADGVKDAKRAKLDKKKMTVNRASVDEHKRFVKQVFSLPDSEWEETQVAKVGKEVVSLKDLGTIMPKQFLNDVAINAYMDMITARSHEYSFLPKVYNFSTFFYESLSSNGYAAVRKYTRRVRIFEHDLLLVPMHDRAQWHWTLAAIDLKRKRVTHYDPLEADANAELYTPACLGVLRNYLKSECEDKLSQTFDFDGWTFDNAKDVPRQRNDFDCGVFVCQYADCLSRDQPIRFNPVQAPNVRRRMIYEVCHGKLLDV